MNSQLIVIASSIVAFILLILLWISFYFLINKINNKKKKQKISKNSEELVEHNLKIGYLSEKLFNWMSKYNMEKLLEKLDIPSSDNNQFLALNLDQETGKPYDFIINDYYIEVKGASYTTNFHISHKEKEFAKNNKHKWRLVYIQNMNLILFKKIPSDEVQNFFYSNVIIKKYDEI